MRQRRFLPSLQQLMAFEAVMRHGAVTKAAKDLDLSQSTVSRLLASLEHQLGKPLFSRAGKRLVPMPEAQTYQVAVTHALNTIQRASMSVVTNPGGGVLSLSVLPTFATSWLGPRLATFLRDNPGIQINQSTRLQSFDFQSENFDAAIYFGAAKWPNVRHQKLFDERLTACAAPGFLQDHPIKSSEDLRHLPLLQLESRGNGWSDWFAAHHVTYTGAAGMVMDQFSMMIQAAISGLGIALLPSYLADVEIAEGRLVPILTPAVPATGAYWLVWPQARDTHLPLQKLRLWLERSEQR